MSFNSPAQRVRVHVKSQSHYNHKITRCRRPQTPHVAPSWIFLHSLGHIACCICPGGCDPLYTLYFSNFASIFLSVSSLLFTLCMTMSLCLFAAPRTPYGSVPDPMTSQQRQNVNRFSFRHSAQVTRDSRMDRMDHMTNTLSAPTMQPIQRTVSASSVESTLSVHSIEPQTSISTFERERSMNLHYAYTLSANNSIDVSPLSGTLWRCPSICRYLYVLL